jgi:hypothetical protein
VLGFNRGADDYGTSCSAPSSLRREVAFVDQVRLSVHNIVNPRMSRGGGNV